MSKMIDQDKALKVSQLTALQQVSSQFSNFGEDYVFCRLTRKWPDEPLVKTPIRINGMTTILCLSGEIDLELNLQPYKLTANSILHISRNNLLMIKNVDRDNLDACLFVISPQFIHDLNFDMNVLSSIKFDNARSPLLSISVEESALLQRYLDLIHINTTSNADAIYTRSISRNLVAALFYQTMQFVKSRNLVEAPEKRLSRRGAYVNEFMSLVYEHHRMERSVMFYASRMFISPKYLSMVIKEATGRTATSWIEDFVILEAKNMLRFSGMSVQQVANELNFPTQSAFGKYFKHSTGMSPTEFQRS